MILERKTNFNIKQTMPSDAENFLAFSASPEERIRIYKEALIMQNLYKAAMKEVSTKLEVLDDEFNINYSHNPIHHLECRIKEIKSILKKMQRYSVPHTLESAQKHIQDIAGIRVICNFINDIYLVEKLLTKQSDITVIKRKDYIEQPKENGYRSLHLVVKVPVFLSDKTENVPVEIQLRTIAMDYWASLEHMLQYKSKNDDMKKYAATLLDCADTLAETEKTMQFIREHILE